MSRILAMSAIGDALGAPYEFNERSFAHDNGKIGFHSYLGGAAGRWTDDTSMALAISYGLLKGSSSANRLDNVARLFHHWAHNDGQGIGMQTAKILFDDDFDAHNASEWMSAKAHDMFLRNPNNSAGNGSLMRVHPIALLPVEREEAASWATAVTDLTHADPLCVDASVLWVEALREGMDSGRLNPYAGLDLISNDRQDYWADLIDEAIDLPSETFSTRGWWVVPTFQQALSAVWSAFEAHSDDNGRMARATFESILGAVRGDTDTVACIAGGMLGALGVVPADTGLECLGEVHGVWPNPLSLGSLVELEGDLRALAL